MRDSSADCRVETVVTGQIDRQDREDRERGGDGNDMVHCYGSLTTGDRPGHIRLRTETEATGSLGDRGG